MDRSNQEEAIKKHCKGLGFRQLMQLQSIMTNYFKEDADAQLHRNNRLVITNRTLSMRCDVLRRENRDLHLAGQNLGAVTTDLQDRVATYEQILFQIFAADPFLRNFYSDDVRFDGLVYDADLADEETERESFTSDEDPTDEHNRQLEDLSDL